MLSPEEVRLGLLSAGFTPVACIGKAPVKKAWQALHEPTEFDIKFWTQTAPAALNTGILARLAPALDIDICDPEAAAAIEALARERFEESGYFLVRGRASTSKRCIPFRTNTPFPKILVKLIPPNGSEKDVERLELLADGQQFIAHGIHPETLEPYTWHGGEPGKIKHEDLPYLHEEEARALVDDAAKILIEQFGYRLATNGSKAKTYTNGNAKPNGSGAHASSGTTDWTPDFADHDELAAFAMTLLRSGMNAGAVVNLLRQNVEALDDIDPDRKARRLTEIPGMVESAGIKLSFEAEPPPAGDGKAGEQASQAGERQWQPPRAELVAMENMKMEPTVWTWEEWIARGEIALIAAAPEGGKTTLALSFAAIVSSGGLWPDMTRAKPGNVLIWTGEDNPEKTILPRLAQMGADPKKIWIVQGKRDERGKLIPFNPATDLPILATTAKEIDGGVDILIIDPIVSVVGGKVDNGNNAGHREKLQPLVDFAKGMNCAAIGITHFTKGTAGKDPVERVTGSLAFGAVARVIFAATKNKSGDPERIFVMAKNNLGPLMGAFGYSIIGAPLREDERIIATRIAWGEPIEGSPRELLAEAEGSDKAPKMGRASYRRRPG
jgi:hypothetical protein